MLQKGKSVLQIIDTATHLSAAPVLDSGEDCYGQLVVCICRVYFQTWSMSYTGLLNRLKTDRVPLLRQVDRSIYLIYMEQCYDSLACNLKAC